MSLVFSLVLHRAYRNGGFFNTRVEFDKYVAADGLAVEIRLPDCDRIISGKINRHSAQRNGTARIGGPGLRDCFQAQFQEGEQVDLRILSPTVLEIKKRSAPGEGR